MKKIFLNVFFILIILLLPVAFADVYTPTLTNVYFYEDGVPVSGEVEYTVNCYGYYDYWYDEPVEEVDDTPQEIELVYSYSATCPEFGCNIYESYYLNYTILNYCDLEGTYNGESFKIEDFSDSPVPECSYKPQYSMSNGDKYYVTTPEYEACTENPPNDDIFACDELMEEVPLSDLIVGEDGYPIEDFCEFHFDIVKGMILNSSEFSDVEADHANYEAISFVKEQGIVSGYKDGTYKPDNEINRAEFTKIIMGATHTEEEIDSCEPEKKFPDVDYEEWFGPYICVAYNDGVISGYPNGTFKPNNTINFVEAAKIIVNAFAYEYEESEVWYEPFVKVLQDKAAIPVTIENLEQNITRGEMAEMIYRLLAGIEDKDAAELLNTGTIKLYAK